MMNTISAFFEAVAKGFSCVETKVDKQCETDVLKCKKNIEKKSNKQEDLILDMLKLLLKYQNSMDDRDKCRVKNYLRKIKRIN